MYEILHYHLDVSPLGAEASSVKESHVGVAYITHDAELIEDGGGDLVQFDAGAPRGPTPKRMATDS